MIKINLRGVTLAVMFGFAALALSACGTTGTTTATSGSQGLGDGRYGVYHFGGLSARNGFEAVEAAEWTPTEWLDLQELDQDCHAQMDPQLPSATSEVLRMGATIGVPTGIGQGLGAVAAFTGVSFADYFKVGGLSAFGSGIGAGIDRVHLTRNYVQYACMQFAVSEARRNGRLRGIGVIPFPGVGSMRALPMPNVPASRGDGRQPSAEPVDEHEQPATIVPM